MKFSLKIFIILLLLVTSQVTIAQEPAFESIKNFIKPAKKDGGLKLSQYFLWCPSVIKVGNTYHMFASAWPAEGGMASWTKSLCIRATSKNLLGPYEFAEVVLEKREGKWDNDRVHNPKIVKVGNKYVLYYISSSNETGYAEADAITGPWTRSAEKMVSFINPAPLVRPDGSVYVFGRLSIKIGDKQVRKARAAEAASYKGPYQNLAPEKDNLFPNNYELEDPTIWWANNQYNVICTDFAGLATGKHKVGVQYYSKDGINYELLTKEPVNTNEITYDDGSKEKFKRVERPFAYVENGIVKAYFLGCMTPDDKGVIVAHPVDDYVPGKSSSKKKK